MTSPSTEARTRINAASFEDLRDTANARIGGSAFDHWSRGSMNRRVAIGEVVLEPGDTVLWTEGRGTAIKVWSPRVTRTHAFILPHDHVLPEGYDPGVSE